MMINLNIMSLESSLAITLFRAKEEGAEIEALAKDFSLTSGSNSEVLSKDGEKEAAQCKRTKGFVGAFIVDENDYRLVRQPNECELLEKYKKAPEDSVKSYPALHDLKIFGFGEHVFVFFEEQLEG